MRHHQKGFTLVEIIIVTLVLVFGVSWVVNIYKLTQCDFEAPYRAEVLHGLGIIPFVAPFVAWQDLGQ